MLSKLSIQNFALIDHLNLDLNTGFTVITGETGAGKSIILGAIDLILGKRSESKNLLDKSKKCVVEAIFSNVSFINDFLVSHDLDIYDELIIRREIKPNGSSRSFVNDSPVKLTQLKELSSKIIEINGQHITNKVGNFDFNYNFIDGFINNDELLKNFTSKYINYKKTIIELDILIAESKLLKEKKDFLEFQIKELNEFPFESWDEQELLNEYNLMSNQEEVNQKLILIDDLFNGNNAVKDNLQTISDYFNELSKNIDVFSDFYNRISSVNIELSDLFYDLSNKVSRQQSDPKRVTELEELVSTINFLIKKFNVVDLEDLKLKKSNLDKKLSSLSLIDEKIQTSQHVMNKSKKDCFDLGSKLFQKRKSLAKEISLKLNNILHRLSMENADIKFNIEETKSIHSHGIDSIDLLISANKGYAYSPISTFSSGGELSRIVLAMKSLLNESRLIPVLIFDEIDTGVSGKIASEIGLLLKNISKKTQIICVTHLPQVAAMGDFHYHVSKGLNNNTTYTEIEKLNRENRLQILATMLGGEKTGRAALDNAAELLN